MELPKNITQIGQADRNCKIYVEDYVVSYIKQLNRLAGNKDIAVALYGTRKIENGVSYIFLYGAGKLDFLQRETRHLSQAQQQEIEKLRKKYFSEYDFQGYRLLNGEMIEGFHICEQDICRYIAGYAQFYEKNDTMLAYMLDTRETEAEPEVFHQEKYDVAKKRQREQERVIEREKMPEWERMPEQEKVLERERMLEQKNLRTSSHGVRKMRFSTAAVFGVLCLVGLAMLWDEQSREGVQVAARQAMTELTEQKVPDATDVSGKGESSTLIAQDSLTEAVLAENVASVEEVMTTPVPATTEVPVPSPTSTPLPTPTPTPIPTQTPTPVPTAQPVITEEVKATASYVIQKGDSMIAICLRQYGDEDMVEEVCMLNDISDPDDIKVGQKILLP